MRRHKNVPVGSIRSRRLRRDVGKRVPLVPANPPSAPKFPDNPPVIPRKEAPQALASIHVPDDAPGHDSLQKEPSQKDLSKKASVSPQLQSQPQPQPAKLNEPAKQKPNVFDFLDKDDSDDTDDSKDSDDSDDSDNSGKADNSNDSHDSVDAHDSDDSNSSGGSSSSDDEDDDDDANDPHDSHVFDDSHVSSDKPLSQDRTKVPIPLNQARRLVGRRPDALRAGRRPPVKPAASSRGCDTSVSQTATSPILVSSLVSKTSADSQQPPTPPDVSPVANPLQLSKKFPPAQMPPATGMYGYPAPRSAASIPAENSASWNFSTMPEGYYAPLPQDNGPVHRLDTPPSRSRSPGEYPHHRSSRKLAKRPKRQPVKSGYGFLASHLALSPDNSGPRLPPLYRRFENVNHRVLLHLQDEIAQMEEDLRALDEYEEMQRIAIAEKEGTRVMPASRRMDVQSQFHSSLHYRRLELMDTLIHKTEQYNNALSAYSKVLQTLHAASEKDINVYRAWMKERRPIASVEARFLEHNKDLVSLTALPAPAPELETPRIPNRATTYPPGVIAAVAILLPLILFGMVSEFTGRLAVVVVVGGAVAANCLTDLERFTNSRDGWKYVAIYICIMTSAALLVP